MCALDLDQEILVGWEGEYGRVEPNLKSAHVSRYEWKLIGPTDSASATNNSRKAGSYRDTQQGATEYDSREKENVNGYIYFHFYILLFF